ncbi:MAG: GTP pyrophosphokinase family protein [Clostridia bacterium]|nr:GTP pyrophosphokinase family protein [Clostridia bacterium]
MKWTDQSLNKPLGEQEGFKLFHREYDDAIQTVYTRLEILVSDFEVRNDYSPIHHIDKRLKTPESIEEKLRRLDCEVSVPSARENIRDIAGLRVVCNFIEDVYAVADMLTSQDDIELVSLKDYIKNPKPNGYRSLHLALNVPVYHIDSKVITPVEVQVRTVAMDFWGSLERQLRYKQNNEGKISDKTNIELKACAEVSAKLDERMQKIFDEVKK